MKTRIIILLAISAIATLSFTFKAGTKSTGKPTKQTAQQTKTESNEPLGGFVSEDKF
jgi:hypothetical protein